MAVPCYSLASTENTNPPSPSVSVLVSSNQSECVGRGEGRTTNYYTWTDLRPWVGYNLWGPTEHSVFQRISGLSEPRFLALHHKPRLPFKPMPGFPSGTSPLEPHTDFFSFTDIYICLHSDLLCHNSMHIPSSTGPPLSILIKTVPRLIYHHFLPPATIAINLFTVYMMTVHLLHRMFHGEESSLPSFSLHTQCIVANLC